MKNSSRTRPLIAVMDSLLYSVCGTGALSVGPIDDMLGSEVLTVWIQHKGRATRGAAAFELWSVQPRAHLRLPFDDGTRYSMDPSAHP